MDIFDILAKKRKGVELTSAEISFFVDGVVNKTIPDYKITAFLMAVAINGLTNRETADLTIAMAKSGKSIALNDISHTLDKHSTGGVGDKTTLICCPIMAAAGVNIYKLSGRGLGHTGGTADKLESINGINLNLDENTLKEIVKENHFSIATSGPDIAAADKILYALRDVTATVDSVPLIASSIMSKKLAVGAENILIDVKTGSGAFMKTYKDALTLSRLLINIGKLAGKNVRCVITDQSAPLGRAVGNSLEIMECLDILDLKVKNELSELSLYLAAKGISMALKIPYGSAYKKAETALLSKKAKEIFLSTVKLEGGDISSLKPAKNKYVIKAEASGFLYAIDAYKIGRAVMMLGSGRTNPDDIIDHEVGVNFFKKPGDKIIPGEPLAVIFYNEDERLKTALLEFSGAIHIEKRKPKRKKLIIKEIK